MRWTAVCCLACCLALAGGSNDYVDYEVHQWRALVAADPPSLQCCQANSLNLCNNVNDTACSDDGLCYCCPNGGGINATIDGDNTTCTCGYRQTCNDVKCKNKM